MTPMMCACGVFQTKTRHSCWLWRMKKRSSFCFPSTVATIHICVFCRSGMHTFKRVYTYGHTYNTHIHEHVYTIHIQTYIHMSCLAFPFSSFSSFPGHRETNTECYKEEQKSVLLCISEEIYETTRNHNETTTKPVTKPVVFYRQIYETTFLKKKRFLVHINNIYRIHRFREKCGKNRVVSWVVSWWFRVVSMWVVWIQGCRDLSMSTLSSRARMHTHTGMHTYTHILSTAYIHTHINIHKRTYTYIH